MSIQRRKFKAEEKVAILKRHIMGNEAISDICDDVNIAPNQYYRWQKEFFDNGAVVFQQAKGKSSVQNSSKLEEKIAKLESRIRHKDNVIAEITEDYLKLKKNDGDI